MRISMRCSPQQQTNGNAHLAPAGWIDLDQRKSREKGDGFIFQKVTEQ
jgi:hypothetical protein